MPRNRRTSIAPIKSAKNRRLTFSKRRQGLFKKGHEIAVLCQAEVLIVLRDVRGRVFQFAACFPTSQQPGDQFTAVAAQTREPKNLVPRPHNGDVNQWIARIATGRAGPVLETRTPFYYDKGCPNLTPIAHGTGEDDEDDEELDGLDMDDEDIVTGLDLTMGVAQGFELQGTAGTVQHRKRQYEDSSEVEYYDAVPCIPNKRHRPSGEPSILSSSNALFLTPCPGFPSSITPPFSSPDQVHLISPSPSVTSPYTTAQIMHDPISPLPGQLQVTVGGKAMAFASASPARAQATAAAFQSQSLSMGNDLKIPTVIVPSQHSPVSPSPASTHSGSSPMSVSALGGMVSMSPGQQLSPSVHTTVLTGSTTPSFSFEPPMRIDVAGVAQQPQHSDPLAFLDLVSSSSAPFTSAPTPANHLSISTSSSSLGRRASVCSANPSAFSPLSHALGRPKSAIPPLHTSSPVSPPFTVTSALGSPAPLQQNR